MDFSFTPEQDELRSQARSFLEATETPTWAQLAELGWTGVSVPEQAGGAGLTFLEEAILHEELGRALYHGPFFSTMALTQPALPPELLAEVAAGEASWTLATGPLVPDLDTADRIAVAAGNGVWELEGAERQVLSTSDETRPLGRLAGGATIRQLAGPEVLPEIRRRARAALALEACGVARRALELGVEHASTREQFGKPIGVYQAISHPLADTYAEVELARSLALRAAWCVAEGDEQAETSCAAAKAYAAETAVAACERSIQVHGGTGFTWEHVLHRLYKRAQWIHAFDASPASLRSEVVAVLLDGEGVR